MPFLYLSHLISRIHAKYVIRKIHVLKIPKIIYHLTLLSVLIANCLKMNISTIINVLTHHIFRSDLAENSRDVLVQSDLSRIKRFQSRPDQV